MHEKWIKIKLVCSLMKIMIKYYIFKVAKTYRSVNYFQEVLLGRIVVNIQFRPDVIS